MTGQCYRCGGWHTQATACPANQPSTAPGWYAGNVEYYAVVMQQDYDALAARLAEAEALLREAREVLREEEVNCCCDEAYTSRNMIDPNCRFQEQDTLRAAAARIDAFLGSKP